MDNLDFRFNFPDAFQNVGLISLTSRDTAEVTTSEIKNKVLWYRPLLVSSLFAAT